jgi:hypothetical protein
VARRDQVPELTSEPPRERTARVRIGPQRRPQREASFASCDGGRFGIERRVRAEWNWCGEDFRRRRSALRVKGNTKIGEDQIEQLAGLQVRIKNECFGDALLFEPLHQAIEQNGLARADFAGKQSQSFTSGDSLNDLVQRLFCLLREEEIVRIWIGAERIVTQLEKTREWPEHRRSFRPGRLG